jgi:hypothetical protein
MSIREKIMAADGQWLMGSGTRRTNLSHPRLMEGASSEVLVHELLRLDLCFAR